MSSIERVLDNEPEAADVVDTEEVAVVVVVVVVVVDDDDADAVIVDDAATATATAGAVEVEVEVEVKVVDAGDIGSTRARVAFGRIFQATMEASS